jgi:hypothetical protein
MYTYSDDIISDLHKDVRGYRPTASWWQMWNALGKAEKQNVWDALCNELETKIEHEKIAEEKAVAEFKERIEQAQVWGARDYFDALRWITGCETFYHVQDIEHFVWEQGILFTDFGKQLIKDIAKVTEYKEYA